MDTLQYRLKTSRQKCGLTQAQLSQKSYVSINTISNVERGITKKLSSNELILLANALKVTEDFLLGYSDNELQTRNGLIQPAFFKPDWDWEIEIPKVLKKHSKFTEIKTILQDYVHFLGQLDATYPKYYDKKEVYILKKTIKLLNAKSFQKDIDILDDFLSILIKRLNLREEK